MDVKIFGAFVAGCRRKKNMTQAQLAAKLHVTDKAVSRWERGVGFPDINTIEPMAEALEISVLDIMKTENKYALEETRIVDRYFVPHRVFVRKAAIETLPEPMQEHVKNGGKLYMTREPKDGKSFISTVCRSNADGVFVDSSSVATRVQAMPPADIDELQEPWHTYLKNKGTLYTIGEPKDGKIMLSDSIEPGGRSFLIEHVDAGRELGNDCTEICYEMRECITIIRNADLSMDERQNTCYKFRDYLIHCLELSELNDLTAIYKDAVDEDMIIGYDPKAAAEFVNELSKRYHIYDRICYRCKRRRDAIYTEIGAILADCIDTIKTTEDEREKDHAVEILHKYLDDCTRKRGVDDLTYLYKNHTDDSKIGYDMDAVEQFAKALTARYKVKTSE